MKQSPRSRAIASAAPTASSIPPSDSVISTPAPNRRRLPSRARAERAEHPPALAAPALRERQHELVPLGGADEGEGDPGVARGRLDDRRADRPAPALPLRGGDSRRP